MPTRPHSPRSGNSGGSSPTADVKHPLPGPHPSLGNGRLPQRPPEHRHQDPELHHPSIEHITKVSTHTPP
jgi:hypothetical protein